MLMAPMAVDPMAAEIEEILQIEDADGRLQRAIENKTVVRRKYYAEAFLQDVNPDGVYTTQESACPELNVIFEDGYMIDFRGDFRAVVGRHMGMEMPEAQADQMERDDPDLNIPRFHVYDVYVENAVLTDGPEERAELMASFENEMKARKNEKSNQSIMAHSLAKLTEFLASGQMNGQQVPEVDIAQMIGIRS